MRFWWRPSSRCSTHGCKSNEYCWVLLFFLVLGVWLLWPALTVRNNSVADFGDGLGAMPWLEVLREILNNGGFIEYVTTPFLINENMGGGMMPPSIPWSLSWRVAISPLISSGLEAEQIYDLWILIIYVLNGLAGYFLGRVLGAPPLLALFVGLLCVGLDNSSERIVGHNTLAANFGLSIQFALAVLVGRSKRGQYLLRYALASCVSFQVNEYYGYYGLIFSALVVLGLWISNICAGGVSKEIILKTLFKSCCASLFFISLMFAVYPAIILGKLGIAAENTVQQFEHSAESLFTYSVLQPLEVFSPFWSDKEWGNNWEFTFRVGLAALIVPFIAIVLIFQRERCLPEITCWRREAVIFGAAGCLLALIGLHPSYAVSLGPLFFEIAPMFRVTARSYLLVDLALIAITCLVLSRYWELYKKELYARFVLLFFCGFVFVDVNQGFGLRQYAVNQMPDGHFVFDKESEKGVVLELPFYSPYARPELSYRYAYHWMMHKNKVMNAPFNKLDEINRSAAEKLDAFSKDIDRLDSSKVSALGRAGVRYILANSDRGDFSYLSTLTGLSFIRKNNYLYLYEISSYVRRENPFSVLLSGYSSSGNPDYRIKLNKANCEAPISLVSTLPLDVRSDKIPLDLTIRNNSDLRWGENGADVRLGALWVEEGRLGTAHEPNFGEMWFLLRKTVEVGERINLAIEMPAPDEPGNYELWLSLMQPGTLWCFHVGVEPLKIPVQFSGLAK